MRPWFGLHLPSYTFPDTPPERRFERTVEQAKAAEAAGFRMVSVMDHLYQIGGIGSNTEPMLEAWSVLAALSRETSKVRLGTLVTGVTYRNPAFLAKQVTTLDVLSGGRAILGIGAAWNEEEHQGYGYAFPPIKERMDRLEEALTIAAGDVHGGTPVVPGHVLLDRPRAERAQADPAGRTAHPHRWRWRAADAEDRGPLRLDDALVRDGPAGLQHKTEVLARHCEAIGRDPGEIERTVGGPVIVGARDAEGQAILERIPPERRAHLTAGTPEQVADGLRPYLDAGFTGFTFNNNLYRTPEQIGRVGELLRLIGG